MRIIRDESEYGFGPSAVALGMFDGVHIGHRNLISITVGAAKERNLTSVVCTFDRHPLSIIAPEAAPAPLTDVESRLNVFNELGVDCALVKAFTRDLADQEPEAFIENLVERLNAKLIVCGRNYSFGARGRGNIDTLKALAPRIGYELIVAPDVYDGGELVSSTLIRRLIGEGDISRAERLLGI